MKIVARVVVLGMTIIWLTGCATTAQDSNLSYRKSLATGFKAHGVSSVTASDGYPTRTGESSIRFEVRDGDCSRGKDWNDCTNDRQRHEYTTNGTAGEVWFNWSLYLPENFPSLYPAAVTLGQFHQHSSPNPPFMFQVSNTSQNSGYSIDRQAKASTLENVIFMTGDEMHGKWTDILVHANWRSDYRGFFRIYVNGETKPRYEYAGSTRDADGGGVYYKFGIYQSHVSRYRRANGKDATTPTQIVYYDDVFTSSSCTKAAVYFDCNAIEQYEKTIVPLDAPPVFERDEQDLYWRYVCWRDMAEANGAPLIPSAAQFRQLSRDIANINGFVSHFKIRQSLGVEITNAHKEELLHLINFAGTTKQYCATLE